MQKGWWLQCTAETGKSALPAQEPGGPSSSAGPTSPLTQALFMQAKSQQGTPCWTRKQNLPSCLQEAGGHCCPGPCTGKFASPSHPCSDAGLDCVAAGTQHEGMDTASIPAELCTWGAQLLGPQGMHCVRACEMCVWMNGNALLQPGRKDRQDEGMLLGWLQPPAPTEAPGTQPGAISQASIALNLCS